MKRILDSVHGYIEIEDNYFSKIIDKPFFQRLRRIEQTSTRSIFPSARHDRFIHSLGVFHIGKMIKNHFDNEVEYKSWNITKARRETIFQSYLLACLLHDVGHAPFSHTFEEYWGRKEYLADELCKLLPGSFKDDIEKGTGIWQPAFHEYTSAILAALKYKDEILDLGGDVELVVRMILGVDYSSFNKKYIENCFISLLHGQVIDADRLDYACRDVWASGYSTSTIDLSRLISAIHIRQNSTKEYVVCFDCNSVNEIESVVNIKDFQQKYVLNHHTILYDQLLLIKAVEYMALKLFKTEGDDAGTKAMNSLCNIESLYTSIPLNDKFNLLYPSDGDFIFLMKQDPDNIYFKEWFGREYSRFPLWKSRDEFYHAFKFKNKQVNLKNRVFEEILRHFLKEKFSFSEDEVWIKETSYKARVMLNDLNILVRNNIVKYTDLYLENNNQICGTFYYVYLAKKGMSGLEINRLKESILEKLQPIISDLYKEN